MIQLHPVSSMRAALKSKYCMRTQLKARHLVNGQANEQSNSEFFSYQEGQHRVVAKAQKTVYNNGKLPLPEEIKMTQTKNGKRWSTSFMEVELAKDVLEVRDGLGNVVNAVVLEPKV